jgi:hypothetical protein
MSKINGAVIGDSKGRQLRLREIDFLEESRIIRCLGARDAGNATYVQTYVIPAVTVAAIDGEACELPASFGEIEHAIKRLGKEGLIAIAEFLSTVVDESEGEADQIKNS